MKQLFLYTILSVSFVSVVGEDLQTESEASKPPKTAVDAESGPSKTKDGKERVPVQMSGPRRLIIDFIQLPDDNRVTANFLIVLYNISRQGISEQKLGFYILTVLLLIKYFTGFVSNQRV